VSLVGAVGEDGAWLVRDLEGYGVSTANISVVQVRYVPVFPWRTCCPGDHDLVLTCIICCRRRSLAALSFNLLRKAKIASVRVSTPTCASSHPNSYSLVLTPYLSLTQGSKLRPSRSSYTE
jgi:hypothetical protein